MIDRTLLKGRAKAFLSTHFWQAFAVCLIFTLLTGGFGITYKFDKDGYDDFEVWASKAYNNNLFHNQYYNIGSGDSDFGYILLSRSGTNKILRISLTPAVLTVMTGAGMAGLLWAVFIGQVLIVGKARYFLEGFKGKGSFGTMFSPYGRGEWIKIAGKMFVMNFYLFLWFLLLIIPGIVKSYAYRMVPYILAEDPTMPISDAIDKSKSMTNGIKMDMFILDLSFLGWYLLGLIPCGLGIYFVTPYHQATLGRLYESLAQDDINTSPFIR